jgi:hypothetical protein
LLNALIAKFASKLERINNCLGSLVSQALSDVNGVDLNGIGIFPCDLLNIHSSLDTANNAETLVLAIVKKGKVQLFIDIYTFVDED